uniref:DNA topoisomerase n=1 Tax=viral metagenome TaxID=1070528 RepID=A0A6C0LNM7_9ZZZZ
MKSLIIVESFTKTKTIKKYLGDRDVVVTFSAGHIYNLPKDTLGFDTDTWDIHYVPTNPNIIKNIKVLARSADIIYLAADPDLEGEAIAHSLFKCLQGIINDGSSGSGGSGNGGKVCHRITFNEITKNAVLNAIDNPRTISMDKVNAQETRRIVDRLIGYKVSPVLWNKFNKNYLSAGRVQIAGLILCINQRNRIINKEIIPYWTIDCVFGIGIGNAITITGTLDHKIRDVKTVKEVLNNATISTKYKISYETRIRNVSPQPPYTTTTLQQDAYNKCRFNAKTTMKLAQDLYEHGYITYMRTDSTSIAEDAKKMILSYIKETFDTPKSAYTYSKYRSYKTKVANAQEAHEAVRITNPKHKSLTFEGTTKNHEKLYALIWKRTLASLMSDAVYHDICLKFEGTSGNNMNSGNTTSGNMDTYYATKPFLKELGFQIVYKEVEEADAADVEGVEGFVDILKKSNMTAVSKEYSSQGTIDDIPSLYNEVQLIKELEKEGIGRPSTYASIIDKLLEKKYVEIGTNPQQEYEIECFKKKKSGIVQSTKKINLGGKQKDLLVPTELGIEVIKYIFELFPYLCDLQFTSKMEDELDKIINASITKEDILNDLYAKIKTSIASIASIPDTQGGSGSRNGSNGNKEKKTGILTTRYGVCYYNKDTDKYTNIEPYLKWKQITKEQLTERDIKFISSLPKPIEYVGKKYNLHLGKYGIYLKDNKNNNHKLDKKLWNDYY